MKRELKGIPEGLSSWVTGSIGKVTAQVGHGLKNVERSSTATQFILGRSHTKGVPWMTRK